MSARNVTIHLSPDRHARLVALICAEVDVHRTQAKRLPRSAASADASRKAGRMLLDLLGNVAPGVHQAQLELFGPVHTWHNGDRTHSGWSR